MKKDSAIRCYGDKSNIVFELFSDGTCEIGDGFSVKSVANDLRKYYMGFGGTSLRIYGDKGPMINYEGNQLWFSDEIKDDRIKQVFCEMFGHIWFQHGEPKCECGSSKCGIPTHSDWCPLSGKK